MAEPCGHDITARRRDGNGLKAIADNAFDH